MDTLINLPKIKSDEEINIMREGGVIWQKIRKEITEFVEVGKSGVEIEKKVKDLFKKYEVAPAFYNYQKFPGIICISVNECVIHGLANDVPLKHGDKITLDIGFLYKNLFVDSAFTLLMNVSNNATQKEIEQYQEYKKFIDLSLNSLWEGIKQVKQDCCTGDITEAIETYVKKNIPDKYALLNKYTGHGIGRNLHEYPHIFNQGLKVGQGVRLPKNSVICIEPILVEDKRGNFKIGSNGYDIISQVDYAQTVHWEHMVAVTDNSFEVLTAMPEEIEKFLGKIQ